MMSEKMESSFIKQEIKEEELDTWLVSSSSSENERSLEGDMKEEKVKTEGDASEDDDYSDWESNFEDQSVDSGEEEGDDEVESESVEAAPKGKERRKGERMRQVLSKLCADAPLTAFVGSQCKFLCFNCKRIFGSWGSLNHHFRTNKDHGPPEDIGKHLTDAKSHKCELCKKRILADRGFLRDHMRQKHKMTLAQYCENTKKKVIERYTTKREAIDPILSACPISSKVVGNFCKFACRRCNAKFNSWNAIKKHFLKTKHSKPIMENLPSCIEEAISHQCLVCAKLVFCDNLLLFSHIKHHGLSLKQYCQQNDCSLRIMKRFRRDFNNGNYENITKDFGSFCEFSCDECTTRFNVASKFIRHFHANHNSSTLKNLSAYLTKTWYYICLICSQKILSDTLALEAHMKSCHDLSCKVYREQFFGGGWGIKSNFLEATTTTVIGSFCRYACRFCQNVLQTWLGLRRHLKVKHGVESLFLNQSPEYLVKTVRFKCQICSKDLFADKYFITDHLRNHRMTIKTYCESFKLREI